MAADKLRERLEILAEDAASASARAAEYDRLMGEADKLRGPIIESCGKHASKFKSLQKDIAALAASGAESSSVKEIEEMASRVSSDLCKASKLKPVTGSLFIRLFLGSVNVKVLHEADRRKLKDEHDKFKSRTNLLFLLIPLSWALNINLLVNWFTYTHWITVFGHLWLLYYYVSLALRENILRVNGSKIQSWWIIHHYISAAMSVVMLTWPYTDVHQELMPTFTAFFLYQAGVMHAQAIYQARRHYGLVAQGKATVMDVANPEGLREYNTNVLLIVLICLLAGTYVFQGFLSFTLLSTAFGHPSLNIFQSPAGYTQELQILFVGVCFAILALFNSISLAHTLAGKWARQFSKQVVDRLSPAAASTSPPSRDAAAPAPSGNDEAHTTVPTKRMTVSGD